MKSSLSLLSDWKREELVRVGARFWGDGLPEGPRCVHRDTADREVSGTEVSGKFQSKFHGQTTYLFPSLLIFSGFSFP